MSPYSPQPNMIYYVNENQFVMKSQQCGRSTEWKYLDHSTTQILREIKLGNFGASKTTKLDLFWDSAFRDVCNFEHFPMQNFLKNQNLKLLEWQKLQLLNL